MNVHGSHATYPFQSSLHRLWSVDGVKHTTIIARHLPQTLCRIVASDSERLANKEREDADACVCVPFAHHVEVVVLITPVRYPQEYLQREHRIDVHVVSFQ